MPFMIQIIFFTGTSVQFALKKNNMNFSCSHTFHIPVMGIGYTIDTPAKVAHYGISSVISLVDDLLIEKMREFYCKNFNIPFQSISNKIEDFRAKRITAYLNVIDEVVTRNFENLKASALEKGNELEKYIAMLPSHSELKKKFNSLFEDDGDFSRPLEWIKEHLSKGSIDVNIMTKLDREHYKGKETLPVEYNDAHAALRGFANSRLNSAVVLSAGMNPSLYGYFSQFDDFFPDKEGKIRKKIILKVSDYRSALIQGKYLAKKGLWISEFRIESGLNCGGHAFATDGFLMGPILEEFKNNRSALLATLSEMYLQALSGLGRNLPSEELKIRYSAQGGLGTAEEHEFLLKYYEMDSAGWGTPFLLVPEAVTIDDNTRKLLERAKEDDLYLSNISPLGVPFNNVKGNTKDLEKQKNIEKGKPGSACPKKHAALNKEFTDQVICIASQKYQKLKIDELKVKNPGPDQFNKAYDEIVAKACICNGLGTSALLVNNLDTKIEGNTVSVCPGPNMAYFSQTVPLQRMVDHIYGRDYILTRNDRPHMFVKELSLYVDYLKNKVSELDSSASEKDIKYLNTFRKNLNEGIEYYKQPFTEKEHPFTESTSEILTSLQKYQEEICMI